MTSGTGKPKILLLYCGGTIAMVHEQANNGPLLPPKSPDAFIEQIRPIVGSFAEMDHIVVIANKDSSNITSDDWKRISSAIAENYDKYDGFVITHGTDTMGYSAAAISYMLQNLNKPVVFTGSQIPLNQEGTDAKRNLEDAFRVASSNLAEVVICFNRNIWRGNRAIKKDAQALDAFDTPGFPPLGHVKDGKVVIESHAITARPDRSPMTLKTAMDTNVDFVESTPFIEPEDLIIRSQIGAEVSAILLKWEGVGGDFSKGKDNPLLGAIRYATAHGVPVVVTHSWAARFGENYREKITALVDSGAIPALDMRAYPALAKLEWCMGQAQSLKGKDRIEEVRKMFATNFRGEVDPNFDPSLLLRKTRDAKSGPPKLKV